MDREGQVQEETPVLPETGEAPAPGWLVGLGIALVLWAGWYLTLSVR